MMLILIHSALGGAMIGASAAGLLLLNGRIAGISGILCNALRGDGGGWRWGFLAGLIGAGAIAAPHLVVVHQVGTPLLILAGLLVGAGTRLGAGCTSGHGVCGIANLSPRSLTATLIFMALGFLTVFVLRHWVGGL